MSDLTPFFRKNEEKLQFGSDERRTWQRGKRCYFSFNI